MPGSVPSGAADDQLHARPSSSPPASPAARSLPPRADGTLPGHRGNHCEAQAEAAGVASLPNTSSGAGCEPASSGRGHAGWGNASSSNNTGEEAAIAEGSRSAGPGLAVPGSVAAHAEQLNGQRPASFTPRRVLMERRVQEVAVQVAALRTDSSQLRRCGGVEEWRNVLRDGCLWAACEPAV